MIRYMKCLFILLGLLWASVGLPAQTSRVQYWGDDTLSLYPLKQNILYAGVWNRLQLISSVWKEDFRPTVCVNKGELRWSKKEPTVVWVRPDTVGDTIRLSIKPDKGRNRDVFLIAKSFPIPDIKIYVNDTMDFCLRNAIYRVQNNQYWMPLDSTHNKWTYKTIFPSTILELCPELEKNDPYQIQEIGVYTSNHGIRQLIGKYQKPNGEQYPNLYLSQIKPALHIWGHHMVGHMIYFEITKIIFTAPNGQSINVTKSLRPLDKNHMFRYSRL